MVYLSLRESSTKELYTSPLNQKHFFISNAQFGDYSSTRELSLTFMKLYGSKSNTGAKASGTCNIIMSLVFNSSDTLYKSIEPKAFFSRNV